MSYIFLIFADGFVFLQIFSFTFVITILWSELTSAPRITMTLHIYLLYLPFTIMVDLVSIPTIRRFPCEFMYVKVFEESSAYDKVV